MVRARVKVIGSGKTREDAFRVNLPTYMMIAGTEQYEAGKLKSVEVEVPEDECTDGRLDKAKIRAKYKGQQKWDNPDVLGDI